MIALMVFGCTIYIVSTEYISSKKSKGEVLLFRRGKVPDFAPKPDVESNVDGQEVRLARSKTTPDAPASIQKQTAIFHWDSVNYDIKIKKEPRRLLDEVDGWVKRKLNSDLFISPLDMFRRARAYCWALYSNNGSRPLVQLCLPKTFSKEAKSTRCPYSFEHLVFESQPVLGNHLKSYETSFRLTNLTVLGNADSKILNSGYFDGPHGCFWCRKDHAT